MTGYETETRGFRDYTEFGVIKRFTFFTPVLEGTVVILFFDEIAKLL